MPSPSPSSPSPPDRGGRTGRRPGRPETRAAVLQAARASFASRGYVGTRLRDVADEADVDVALVAYFFGAKDRLFSAAMELPFDPADVVAAVLDGPRDGVPRRMLERFLGVWDAPGAADPLVALVRSAATHEPAADLLREFVHHGVIGPLLERLAVDERERRSSLVAAQLLGLVLVRYVVRVEPLASDDRGTVVAALEPVMAQHVFGPLR